MSIDKIIWKVCLTAPTILNVKVEKINFNTFTNKTRKLNAVVMIKASKTACLISEI